LTFDLKSHKVTCTDLIRQLHTQDNGMDSDLSY